jgi:hypothetical protein
MSEFDSNDSDFWWDIWMLFELYYPIYWYWSAPLQRVGYSNLNGKLAETVKDALYDRNILFHDWILLLIY